ncbi:DUF2786 domain-containing protein [Emergencia sp. 1XD21-10]|uniref:DUF2786 domain-containing protein n=1 Tax=Emergencia sp. 1XD21-10 TaxID=2304569 RepID=UPI00137A55E0|nr:DUF2786 domain-containing protein [Emergencia sp. 1XD21-10]NCE98199.1 DUF2786 domain-containing protein [Emergencia sp. 1XD21-10]
MANLEQVKKKIKKLLALADSSNEFEAKVAMAKAQKLLMEYKLNLHDIEERQKEIVHRETPLYFTEYKNGYRANIASLLSEFYCCRTYQQSVKGSKKIRIMIVGFQDDVEILESLLIFADECIMDWFRSFKKSEGWKYSNVYLNGLKNRYGLGFAEGLEELLQKQMQEIEQEWGLVPAVPKEAQDFISTLQAGKELAFNLSEDMKIYTQGYKDGKSVDLHNKITSTRT